MKIILKLLLVALFLTSCEDDFENKYGRYYGDRAEIGKIRLFTKEGEIIEQTTISSFLKRHEKHHSFIQNLDSIIDKLELGEILYNSSTEAVFNHSEQSFSYDVINKNQILYLESSDTILTPINFDNPFRKKMFLYRPIYSDTILPPTTINAPKYLKYKPCVYLTISSNTIKYPIMSFFIFNSSQYSTNYTFTGGINNIFNEESISFLENIDTIAIQENKYLYVK